MRRGPTKGGLQLDSQGNLSTRYPWEKSRRRKSVDSDIYYSDSDRSRSSTGSRRKAEPVNKDIIDEALRNYGTVGKVEALEINRNIRERPDSEKLVKIPRPVASGMVTEGSMRYPAPDYSPKKRIEMPRLTATRTRLRSFGGKTKHVVEESIQVPEDTFIFLEAESDTSEEMPEDMESILSRVSEKPEVKPLFDYAEKIKSIYEELKPVRKSTIETQTDLEPTPVPSPLVVSEIEEEPPTPEPEREPTPAPTPPPPRPVMVDTGTFMEPVYEPLSIIPAEQMYSRREPVVKVEEAAPEPEPEPEPAPSEAASTFADKDIQADPDDIDNKPRILLHTMMSLQPDAELEDLLRETEEKAIQTGYSKLKNREIQANPPVDQEAQTEETLMIHKELQTTPEYHSEEEEIQSIISSATGSTIGSSPYQPLSYGPPPPKFRQPKSWGTTARVDVPSGMDNNHHHQRAPQQESGEDSSLDSSPRLSVASHGMQTTTSLDTRAASMIRKLHDLESLSGILDMEAEDYVSSHGDDFPPDVVSDTLSVKSGFF